MSAFVIFDVEIRDPGRCQEFMQGVKPALEQAGARYLAPWRRTQGLRGRLGTQTHRPKTPPAPAHVVFLQAGESRPALPPLSRVKSHSFSLRPARSGTFISLAGDGPCNARRLGVGQALICLLAQ